MTTIYHNPRCSKSRETLALLEEQKEDVTIIKYLDTPITKDILIELIDLLGIPPIDLVRKNETIWKEKYKNEKLSDDEIINAMLNHPKLIERPIVVKGNKAILGRPPQQVITIL
ncbi:arsenate reductase (glutaredoxin) [Aquimarina sp. AD10]|uniref:Arsenate reductase n=1 Tax=Aquimarina aggregata TaxID=1642818 RepID=A0A163CQJ2_9FLAO|nr:MULTISPECIES: arsenate reductase (glutaredoxin) [Aquimarina]AXT59339.1 arsenate reductase (glutaredoxin) [Aquimarina sp. AD10]KZS42661.1 arsenate reductase [Aquimarina aggregata]